LLELGPAVLEVADQHQRFAEGFATTEADIARFADGVQHFTRPIARDEREVAA
jgi:hypothetical protein